MATLTRNVSRRDASGLFTSVCNRFVRHIKVLLDMRCYDSLFHHSGHHLVPRNEWVSCWLTFRSWFNSRETICCQRCVVLCRILCSYLEHAMLSIIEQDKNISKHHVTNSQLIPKIVKTDWRIGVWPITKCSQSLSLGIPYDQAIVGTEPFE